MIDIDRREADLTHRFLLEVSFDDFISRIGSAYSQARDFLLQEGTGDDYVDRIGIPYLEHIKNNDTHGHKE